MDEIDLREKLAHIDLMLKQHNLTDTHIDLMMAQKNRVIQETQLAPWLLTLSGMTTGAAFFAAGVAFIKIFG